MSFNTIIDWNSCTAEQQRQLLMRPAISASESITRTVNDILDNVKARGNEAPAGNTARSLIKPRLPH